MIAKVLYIIQLSTLKILHPHTQTLSLEKPRRSNVVNWQTQCYESRSRHLKESCHIICYNFFNMCHGRDYIIPIFPKSETLKRSRSELPSLLTPKSQAFTFVFLIPKSILMTWTKLPSNTSTCTRKHHLGILQSPQG